MESIQDMLLRATLRFQGLEDQMPENLRGVDYFAIEIVDDSEKLLVLSQLVGAIGGWSMTHGPGTINQPDHLPRHLVEFRRL